MRSRRPGRAADLAADRSGDALTDGADARQLAAVVNDVEVAAERDRAVHLEAADRAGVETLALVRWCRRAASGATTRA